MQSRDFSTNNADFSSHRWTPLMAIRARPSRIDSSRRPAASSITVLAVAAPNSSSASSPTRALRIGTFGTRLSSFLFIVFLSDLRPRSSGLFRTLQSHFLAASPIQPPSGLSHPPPPPSILCSVHLDAPPPFADRWPACVDRSWRPFTFCRDAKLRPSILGEVYAGA